jgi:hypothetical protein
MATDPDLQKEQASDYKMVNHQFCYYHGQPDILNFCCSGTKSLCHIRDNTADWVFDITNHIHHGTKAWQKKEAGLT